MVEPALFDDTKYIGVPDYIFGPELEAISE